MNNTNELLVEIDSNAKNEALARVIVAAFITSTNPTLEEVSDVKTAVSEAVTNCIIHGYEKGPGKIRLRGKVTDREVYIVISDLGVGIQNVEQAMEPLFTTKPDEDRSGMGFSFMEAFMDRVEVASVFGEGTVVKMWKEIGANTHPFE